MANLIESGNFLVLIIALYAAWRTIRWNRRSDLTPYTRSVIHCWMFVFGGIGINRGWFAISRFLHNGTGPWQATMYEWRWLLVLVTSSMVTWGVVSFVELIDETSVFKKYMVFIAVAIVAFGIGFY